MLENTERAIQKWTNHRNLQHWVHNIQGEHKQNKKHINKLAYRK